MPGSKRTASTSATCVTTPPRTKGTWGFIWRDSIHLELAWTVNSVTSISNWSNISQDTSANTMWRNLCRRDLACEILSFSHFLLGVTNTHFIQLINVLLPEDVYAADRKSKCLLRNKKCCSASEVVTVRYWSCLNILSLASWNNLETSFFCGVGLQFTEIF